VPGCGRPFLDSLGGSEIRVKASPMVAAQIASVDGGVHYLCSGKNAWFPRRSDYD